MIDQLATIPKGAKPALGFGPKSTMERLWNAYATSDDFSAFLRKLEAGPRYSLPNRRRLRDIWDAFDFAYEAARDEFDPPNVASLAVAAHRAEQDYTKAKGAEKGDRVKFLQAKMATARRELREQIEIVTR